MKKLVVFNISLLLMGSLFIGSTAKAEEAKYSDKKVLAEKLVNEAAVLIETKGQAGIDIIKDKNGKFNTKDMYVFVTSFETGADLVNPAFKEVEGLPAQNYTDPDAKAAQMAIVNAVKDKDTAWLEYLWPKPGEAKLSKKMSYLKKININGKTRIIGAGFYAK